MGGIVGVCVLGWMSMLSVYDLRQRRLPNWLTVPGGLAILTTATVAGRGIPAMFGALVLFGVYLAVHFFAPAALGAGDVKLAFGVGGLTGTYGIDVWVLATLAAPLLTAGWAVGSLIWNTKAVVPHGPSMCVASAAAITLAVV
jgi:leader peptidase (prepilin peptidase) / N-methyltransferase